ncbi:MAG: hypothetical protein ACI4SO_07845, partial [Muribaculaceae bacterium]
MRMTRRGAQRRRLVHTNTVPRGSESHVLWYHQTLHACPTLFTILYSLFIVAHDIVDTFVFL